MVFKVFISHSVSPKELAAVYTLAEEAAKRGLHPYVPDRRWDPLNSIPERIRRAIKDADCVVVMGTRYGMHNEWLNRELEETLRQNKKPLLVADPEIQIEPHFEQYKISIDRSNFPKTIQEAARLIESIKLKKAQNKLLTWLVVGGLLFLLFREEK